ncbi:MAG: amidase family protein [bacterium]|nr:amidase family protein [bacterium]
MELRGLKLIDILKLIESKKVSSKEVFNYFSNRSKKYNKLLNAYITILESGSGVPISYKDNFLTKGIKTTASSNILKEYIAPYSATVVNRLLDKNFSILGKTNMDAWAHGSSTETSDFGPTKNPWGLKHSPGGSSGGAAAAVTSYLSPVAIGSETAGSIRQPASWSGVVGLKPTYGRVSRYGVIAMGSSLDSPGVLALSVEDCAYILKIIAGKDNYDATTSNEKVPDYLSLIKNNQKFTIGISEEYLKDVNAEIRKNFFKTVEVFKKLGHNIKKIKLIDPSKSIAVYTIIQRAEVSSNLSRYDGLRFGKDRSFFGEEAKRRIILGTFTLSQGYIDKYYKKAQQLRTLIINDFDNAFKEVDMILAPTTPTSAFKLGEFEKYPFFGELMDKLNEPSSISGLPGISIPVGLGQNKLPIGMQIIGKKFAENEILNLAYQFEKETNYFGITKQLLVKYPD